MTIECIYSDIDIGLERATSGKYAGDIIKHIDENAVKQSLINILTTKKGDRRMYPTFGASLEKFLFEPIDKITADAIADLIINEITYWDSRVVFEKVHVNANHDINQYEINIHYYISMEESKKLQEISFVLRAI